MNPYIKQYNELLQKGYNDLEALGMVASRIAFQGTMEDLQLVQLHFTDGLINDCKEIFGGDTGANIVRTQRQVS